MKAREYTAETMTLCCGLAYHTFSERSGTGPLLLVYCCLEQLGYQVIRRQAVLLGARFVWSWWTHRSRLPDMRAGDA